VRIVGLTGGIACGKSTVSALLQNPHCIPVVDADIGAREVVKPGTVGFHRVKDLFMNEVYPNANEHHVILPDGFLDREMIGRYVFKDVNLRSKLNAMLHPLIREWAFKQFDDIKAKGFELAMYDAALLVETNAHREFDGLVVVTTTPEIQLKRLMKRNGFTEEQARDRIGSQVSQMMRVAVATHVVDTSGPKEELPYKVERLVEKLRAERP